MQRENDDLQSKYMIKNSDGIVSKKHLVKPIYADDVSKTIDSKISLIENEIKNGLDEIKKHKASVSFFGSARSIPGDKDYESARSLAGRIVNELGYSIITGGGPGIMEAANRGAHENNGSSVGFTIQLPSEQITNNFLTKHLDFHYFFTRKICLTFSAEAFVYFPGGFGTYDELFEILTLVQTEKIRKVPIILFNKEYWSNFITYIKEKMLEGKYIDEIDMGLFTVTDSIEEAIEIIKKVPIKMLP